MRKANSGDFCKPHDPWSAHGTGIQEGRSPSSGPSRSIAMRALGPVVYAVRLDDVIKIGHTADLADRLRALRYHRGAAEVELLAFRPGTLDDEQRIHERLLDHVASGREYYHPTEPVMVVVNEMRTAVGMEALDT